MKHNIRLNIAYEGTGYFGWQIAKEGPSIEGSLKTALERILQHEVILQAASRTDAGVHATGQVVNFFTFKKLDLARLRISLNHLLPKSIAVLSASEENNTFHPTLDVISKEYRYLVCYGPAQLPQYRLFSWHHPFPLLDVELMRNAGQCIVGEHDFLAFHKICKNTASKTTIREVTEISIEKKAFDQLEISIIGPNFLYRMVRCIVGALVSAGTGRLTVEAISALILNPRARPAAVIAPAHGLTLCRVCFRG